MTRSLYEQAMGDDFLCLDLSVQAFHRLRGRHVLQGVVRVDAPSSPLAGLLGRLLGAPTTRVQGPIRFEMEAEPQGERWTRHFPCGTPMASGLMPAPLGVVEQLGPVRLLFALEAADGRLLMHLRGMRLWGLPCPAWALPQVIAEESGRGSRLHFLVRAAVPLLGQVTAYTGYLELPMTAADITPA